MIKIIPGNETYVKIFCDDFGIEQEISEAFTFFVPGYKYHPKFKIGMWDGKIKLFNLQKKTIYKGLIEEIIKFAKRNDYEIEVDITLKRALPIEFETIKSYIDELNLHGKGKPIEIRQYQYEAIHEATKNERSLLLSPTSSGKSAIIYGVIRWHIKHNRRILIVVPTTMLVNQLFSDFQDYSSANGWDVEDNISMLYSGKERIFEKNVVISTWQSLAAMTKNDKEKFQDLVERTEVMMLDECLDESSLISMADGSKKMIKDIVIGDLVLTTNETTHKIEYKPVVKLHKNISINEKMFEITLDDGKILKVTGNHKIMLENGDWKRVDELLKGDSINTE